MSDLQVANITTDCTGNATELAQFYAGLLGRAVNPGASEYFAALSGSPTLMFIRVPDRTPGKNSVHIDMHTDDIPAAVERAVSLGAKHVGDFDEYGARWATLTDPEGNLFDIGAS
ncbi:VOC family protein [Dactylosporangium vinaceum]|uniref:VOC family protein n=1 Tax=Dactylosporangium vinaceum TaxID=53362 RepID=A0ABV5MIQ7_9ACTN|nr:VOC family protein [Dactylosporangium vinaceum]UAB93802.1 VOC family protein [Dactylosporangium vinaceum]